MTDVQVHRDPIRADPIHLDTARCVRAVQSKDARFDGWFFTAVLTTGIYCRPSCPVVPPKPEHMRFYPSAAAAQQAGFRACKRCRPDASPGSPEWDVRADVVARAMRLIADGVMDDGGVPALASRLGYSVRQVERQLLAELGAGPLALARAQRAQTARLLIETTTLPMGDVAFAAGFASIRTFNDTVREVFALSPSQLRDRASRGHPARRPARCRCGCRSGCRCSRTACSVTWPPRPCPASRNGGTAPTGGRCGCRTVTVSSRCGRSPITSAASCASPTCGTWRARSAGAAGCWTWTPTRSRSHDLLGQDDVLAPWSARRPAGACRGQSTPPSSPCAPFSASRSRPRRRARMRAAWPPRTASRSTILTAA